jgi:hypothetical protein
MMMHSDESETSERRLHYDSPANSYKKEATSGLASTNSYLSPKSKVFLSPSENGGDLTPPTSKASSSPDNYSSYSPHTPASRSTSSGSGVIDHTALLLGLHDEFEDESDDEAKHCCFSPMASSDALDGMVEDNSDDESDAVDSDGPPLQLTIDSADRNVMSVSKTDGSNILGATDLSLVASQLEAHAKKETIDVITPKIPLPQTMATRKSEQSINDELSAVSDKSKKSAAKNVSDIVFSMKGKAGKKKPPKISLPRPLSTRKSEQRINDELSAASNKGRRAAKHASEMVSSMKEKAGSVKEKAGSVISHKAHKVKDKTLEVVGRKAYHRSSDELSHIGSEAISLLSEDVSDASSGSRKVKKHSLKLPSLPRPPKTLSLKKGNINTSSGKKFKHNAAAKNIDSKDKGTIDQHMEQQQQQQQPRSVCSRAPSSVISPTNSYDMSSCIDPDGFLFSPQSSLGFISPTASIDENGIDGDVVFDAFNEMDGFENFESASTSRIHQCASNESEMLAGELKAAIQSKCSISSIQAARKPPLPPGRSYKAKPNGNATISNAVEKGASRARSYSR